MAPVGELVRRPWAPAAGLAGFVLVARLPSVVGQLFDPDEAAISAQAIALRRGGELYVDAIDRKPPLAPFVYEWSHALTGDTDLRPVHVLAGVVLVVAGLIVAAEARRVAGERASWWAGALMVTGALAMSPVDAQAANYSHLALPFGAVAIVAARRGTDRGALVAGLALALATLFRQTWAIGVLPATVAIWRFGDWRRHVPLALVGGLVPVGLTALVVPWDDFVYWTFESNGSFVLEGAQLGPVLARAGASTALFVGFHLVAVAGAAVGVRRSWRSSPDLWLWVATGLVAVTAGFRFYGHYWLQVVPALSLLAGLELGHRPTRQQVRAAAVVATTAVVAFVLAWMPGTVRELPDPEPLAAVVRAETDPGDTVLIWGNFPEVMWSAERAPAAGFVSMDFVTGRSGARANGPDTIADAPDRAYPHLLAALEARPPALVIDTAPRALRDYDAYPLGLFPELEAFIGRHYGPPERIDGVDVYRLR